jgi:hypothetical protein
MTEYVQLIKSKEKIPQLLFFLFNQPFNHSCLSVYQRVFFVGCIHQYLSRSTLIEHGGYFHSFLYVYQRLCYTTGGQSFGMVGIGRTIYIYIHPPYHPKTCHIQSWTYEHKFN